jgi:hypothetical protein
MPLPAGNATGDFELPYPRRYLPEKVMMNAMVAENAEDLPQPSPTQIASLFTHTTRQ